MKKPRVRNDSGLVLETQYYEKKLSPIFCSQGDSPPVSNASEHHMVDARPTLLPYLSGHIVLR